MTTNGISSSHPVPLLINGEDVQTKETFDVIGPENEKAVWKASSASVEDVTKAAESAQRALKAWSKTSPSERRTIFLKTADILEGQTEELGKIMQQETGAAPGWAAFNIMSAVEMLRDISGRISAAVEGTMPWSADPSRGVMVLKEPYGVVLGIAPWNALYILGMRAVANPLAGGITAILKGSELSPRVFYSIGAAFRSAGLPAGVVNVVYHSASSAAEITTALIAHPAVRKINFTGSTAVGSIIAQTASKHIKPVLLELGGKAPAIVFEDADLEVAAQGCVEGAYAATGQVCMSTERVIVQKSIKEKFTELLKKAMEKMFDPHGDAPLLVTAAGKEKTQKLIESALKAGAKSLTGEPNWTQSTKTRMRPLIIDNVTKDMDLYYAESFGPQLTLLEFETEEEAVEIANDTEYGLAAAVFTKDLAKGLRVAKGIESGAIHINHMTVHDEPRLVHGGTKSSGFGRFGSSFGIDEFLQTKTITYAYE